MWLKKRGPHAAHVLGTLETGFEVACCIWNIFIVVATSSDSVANGSKRLLKPCSETLAHPPPHMAAESAAATHVDDAQPPKVLDDLKRKRQELKASLKLVSKTLKNESKKQKRLIARAGRLSRDDLLFLIARQQGQPRQ